MGRRRDRSGLYFARPALDLLVPSRQTILPAWVRKGRFTLLPSQHLAVGADLSRLTAADLDVLTEFVEIERWEHAASRLLHVTSVLEPEHRDAPVLVDPQLLDPEVLVDLELVHIARSEHDLDREIRRLMHATHAIALVGFERLLLRSLEGHVPIPVEIDATLLAPGFDEAANERLHVFVGEGWAHDLEGSPDVGESEPVAELLTQAFVGIPTDAVQREATVLMRRLAPER